MTKDVIVSISGLQMPAEGEAEPVEVITVGDYLSLIHISEPTRPY